MARGRCRPPLTECACASPRVNAIIHPNDADGERRDREMKTYAGQRAFDGLMVTVDGLPLPEHYDVERYTTWGFEWTYEGESPQQLALAILYDHLGDKTRAIGTWL